MAATSPMLALTPTVMTLETITSAAFMTAYSYRVVEPWRLSLRYFKKIRCTINSAVYCYSSSARRPVRTDVNSKSSRIGRMTSEDLRVLDLDQNVATARKNNAC